MKVSFDSFHRQLDATIIGVMATDSFTEYVHCLDGSIVTCDSPEDMHDWLSAHDIDAESEIDFVFYEDVIGSMCEDAATYHMDAGASQRFLALRAQDQRFHPEILHYTDDGWTMFTSVFNPYEDDLNELRTAINSFVIGYMTNEADAFQVTGQPHSLDASPLTHQDYERLALLSDRLDRLARGRLVSLEFWLWMLREYDV